VEHAVTNTIGTSNGTLLTRFAGDRAARILLPFVFAWIGFYLASCGHGSKARTLRAAWACRPRLWGHLIVKGQVLTFYASPGLIAAGNPSKWSRFSFCEFEKHPWQLALGIGRALVGVFLVVRAQRPTDANYQHEGRAFMICEVLTNEMGTLFGKVTWSRPAGRRANNRRWVMGLPVDR
jgi:hypothetical protein